jgi:hypothetical protein
MKTSSFGGDGASPSGVVRNMSNSSRSTVLSKQEYESVKRLLRANKDVARHPEVRKQTFLVFRLLQNVSKRFTERGGGVIDDDDSSNSSEDPALAFVEDLLQRHSNVDFGCEGDEELFERTKSERSEDISASLDSSSGLIEGNDRRSVDFDHIVDVGVSIESLPNDSLKQSPREPVAVETFFGPCLLSSLCFLREETKEEEPMVEESLTTVEMPVEKETPPGLVFRVTDAFLDARNDNEGEASMMPAVDDALRTLQGTDPRQAVDDDEEDDGGEVLRVHLGRGGPYDNLLRILHNIQQSQGEGRESPDSSHPTEPRGDSEIKAPAKLWLSMDRRAWKVQDSE